MLISFILCGLFTLKLSNLLSFTFYLNRPIQTSGHICKCSDVLLSLFPSNKQVSIKVVFFCRLSKAKEEKTPTRIHFASFIPSPYCFCTFSQTNLLSHICDKQLCFPFKFIKFLTTIFQHFRAKCLNLTNMFFVSHFHLFPTSNKKNKQMKKKMMKKVVYLLWDCMTCFTWFVSH